MLDPKINVDKLKKKFAIFVGSPEVPKIKPYNDGKNEFRLKM